MSKKLPNVFQSKINKNLNNNNKIYYGKGEKNHKEENNIINVKQKINEIFSSPNYVYKANVEIILKDKTIVKRIIGRNKEFIITMDNELISIDSILDIKALKK